MMGTASFCYYAHSEVLDVPDHLKMVLRREDAGACLDTLNELVEWFLGLEDQPIRMSAQQELEFQQAERCYLCNKRFIDHSVDNGALVGWMHANRDLWTAGNGGRWEQSYSTAMASIKAAVKVYCADDCRPLHGIGPK